MKIFKKFIFKKVNTPILLLLPLYTFMFSYMVFNIPIASGQSVTDLLVHFDQSGGDSWVNTGNVGIGTISPGYKLDIAGESRAEGNHFTAKSVSPSTATAGNWYRIASANSKSAYGEFVIFDNSYGSVHGSLKFVASNYYGGAFPKITILHPSNRENIGISLIRLVSDATAPGSTYIEVLVDATGNNPENKTVLMTTGYGWILPEVWETGSIPSGYISEEFDVLSTILNGNVGFGTYKPKEDLHVKGGKIAMENIQPGNTDDTKWLYYMENGTGFKFSWRYSDGTVRQDTLEFYNDGGLCLGNC